MVAAMVPFPHHCHHFYTKALFVFICSPNMQQWSDCSHSHKHFTQISLSTRCSLHPSLCLWTWASIFTFKLASSNSFDSCCCLQERELSLCVRFPMWRGRGENGWKEKKHPQQCSTWTRGRVRKRWGIRSDDPAEMRAGRYFTRHQACFSLTWSLEKEIDFCPTRPLLLLSWCRCKDTVTYENLCARMRAHIHNLLVWQIC